MRPHVGPIGHKCQLKKKKAQPKSAELCLIWNITEDFLDYNFSEDCFKEK